MSLTGWGTAFGKQFTWERSDTKKEKNTSSQKKGKHHVETQKQKNFKMQHKYQITLMSSCSLTNGWA